MKFLAVLFLVLTNWLLFSSCPVMAATEVALIEDGNPPVELLILDTELRQAFRLTINRFSMNGTPQYDTEKMDIASAQILASRAILRSALRDYSSTSREERQILDEALFSSLSLIAEKRQGADFIDLLDLVDNAVRPKVLDKSQPRNSMPHLMDSGFKFGLASAMAVVAMAGIINLGGQFFIFPPRGPSALALIATVIAIRASLIPKFILRSTVKFLLRHPSSGTQIFWRSYAAGAGSIACGQIVAKLVTLIP